MAGKKSAQVVKKATAKRVAAKAGKSSDPRAASKRIDKKIADLGDWRGERLGEIRKLKFSRGCRRRG